AFETADLFLLAAVLAHDQSARLAAIADRFERRLGIGEVELRIAEHRQRVFAVMTDERHEVVFAWDAAAEAELLDLEQAFEQFLETTVLRQRDRDEVLLVGSASGGQLDRNAAFTEDRDARKRRFVFVCGWILDNQFAECVGLERELR